MTPEKFYKKTERQGECLIWQGKAGIGNYGTVGYRWGQWLVHRLSYFFATGEHPGGQLIRHKCDTPLCVEPSHLEPGTHQDNMDDMTSRGRNISRDTHPNRKLSSEDVAEIRARHAAGGVMQKELAKEYGVSAAQMGRIIRGIHWTEKGS